MQARVQHPVYGEIIYNENVWTGKKELSINGNFLPPVSKKTFVFNGQNADIEGSYLGGAKLLINNEIIEIAPKPKWYEIFLSVLPFVFLLVWGNNASLCAIFPVVGGAIGGALGGLGVVFSLLYMKKANSLINKVLVGIGAFVATVLAAFVVALLIMGTL
ncbi:MAG: hypothetical protein J6A88_03640 [Oscillospiraceae bacterium]|nr:hypothetical protein [Oscillospiraceae bacterium]